MVKEKIDSEIVEVLSKYLTRFNKLQLKQFMIGKKNTIFH